MVWCHKFPGTIAQNRRKWTSPLVWVYSIIFSIKNIFLHVDTPDPTPLIYPLKCRVCMSLICRDDQIKKKISYLTFKNLWRNRDGCLFSHLEGQWMGERRVGLWSHVPSDFPEENSQLLCDLSWVSSLSVPTDTKMDFSFILFFTSFLIDFYSSLNTHGLPHTFHWKFLFHSLITTLYLNAHKMSSYSRWQRRSINTSLIWKHDTR